jgi:HEPN domain-containing protein
MKETTKDWLTFAEEDLIAARTLSKDDRLTGMVSFHCQQCLEKCFKAVIEELDKTFLKSHDLLRLQLYAGIELSDQETFLLSMINEVYIDARYPGDMGLLPHGKPTIPEVNEFIELCEKILERINKTLIS